MNISNEQRLNMLAIELLEQEGHDQPTQQQIDTMEWHLKRLREVEVASFYVKNKQKLSA